MKALNILTFNLSLALALHLPAAQAHGALSDLSEASLLPVAISAAPLALTLSAGMVLTVVAVEASAAGTVWVLERASDGVRISLKVAGRAAHASAHAIGGAVVVTALSTGYVLSAAGQVIAFVPNAIGQALLHHEVIRP